MTHSLGPIPESDVERVTSASLRARPQPVPADGEKTACEKKGMFFMALHKAKPVKMILARRNAGTRAYETV